MHVARTFVHPRTSRRRHRRARRSGLSRPGFTLLEAALATVIIGVGVLALLEAHQSFLRANSWSTRAAEGTYLANEIREYMRGLPRHDPVTGLYLDSADTLHGWGPDTGEVVLADFDDVDDFDGPVSTGLLISWQGTDGLEDNDLPGPISADGNVIPEILADGNVPYDSNGVPLPLQGWSQFIQVEKLHPFDTGTVMADSAVIAPDASFDGVGVDGFPLRVSVTTRYQAPGTTSPVDIVTVVWVVP
jgi:hypothetical protein